MKEKRNKKEIIALGLFILSLVLIATGSTFAFYKYSQQGQTENKLESGTLTLVYDENRKEKNGVSLTNAFPISDTDGKTQTDTGYFEFQIKSEARGASIYYEIYLTKEDSSTFPEYTIKTYLTEVTSGESEIQNPFTKEAVNLYSDLGESAVPSILNQKTTGKTLYQGTVSEQEITKNFRFRMWIDEEANQVRGGQWIHNYKTFSVKVNVYAQNSSIPGPTNPAEICNDSNVNEPKLVDGMIPVYYDYEAQTWKKANAKSSDWYNYCNQEWANAVTIVLDEDGGTKQREEYQKAAPDTPIEMQYINTMWVWIPKYEYDYQALQNLGTTPGEIDVKFIDITRTNETEKDKYKVHPAFTFGEEELTGFWYGKFETSNEEAIYGDNNDSRANNSSLTPIIKPGVPSWRFITLSNIFYASRKMQTEKYKIYGFPNDESYDTHMSKNSEWGAVAYLSQSKYGKKGRDGEEVYINNCNQYITGIAGDTADAEASETTCETNTYETLAGQKASTTGNITGIYDMNGGSWERIMGVLDNGSGKLTTALSGFVEGENGNKIIDKKYYDLYGSSIDTACNGTICYGHALSETSGWYGDYHAYVTSSSPWFNRSGGCFNGTNAGVFGFSYTYGGTYVDGSFRLVLAPIE